MICFDDLSFKYSGGADLALSNIKLNIEDGEFVGVIGTSGAGKTTLTYAINGIIPHLFKGDFYGSVTVNGKDTVDTPVEELSNYVGEVFQDIDSQMVAGNVEDELLFGLENFGIPKGEIEDRIKEVLKRLDIEDLRHRQISTLSGGQKQKVAIASILALDPPMIVMDEPTGELDPVSSFVIFDTLKELNRKYHKTVVIVEQKIMLLAEYVDRLLVMEKGSVILDGPTREVIRQTDRLREVGINIPRVTELTEKLTRRGIYSGEPALNLQEAESIVRGLVGVGGEAVGEEASAKTPQAATVSEAPVASVDENTSETPYALDFDHVTFGYLQGKETVKDISIKVRKGEIVALIGNNGAGKSTLSKLSNGLCIPDKGSVRVFGESTGDTPTSKLARKLSFLFQNPDRQLCENTVREEIAFTLKLRGLDEEYIKAKTNEMLETFHLNGDWFPFTRSRGERQRIALASVLAADPEIIILDEPTTGLDYKECIEIMDYLRMLNKTKGLTIFMVSHDMELVQEYAERVLVLNKGELVCDGPVNEVMRKADLLRAAKVLPAQIPELALRLGSSFKDVITVDDCVTKVEEEVGR